MPRALMPGRWARDLSRAIPDNACTGDCNQGRACTCRDTELACDIAPDADRVIQPPKHEPEPNFRARANGWAVAVVVFLYLGLAALLGIEGHKFTP